MSHIPIGALAKFADMYRKGAVFDPMMIKDKEVSGSVLDCEVGDLLVFVDNEFNSTYSMPHNVVELYPTQIVLVGQVVGHLVVLFNPVTLVFLGRYSINRFERYSDVS